MRSPANQSSHSSRAPLVQRFAEEDSSSGVLRIVKGYFLCFNHLADPPLRVLDERSSDALPHLLHGGEEGLCVMFALELEVDHGDVWIVDGSHDSVTVPAGLLP